MKKIVLLSMWAFIFFSCNEEDDSIDKSSSQEMASSDLNKLSAEALSLGKLEIIEPKSTKELSFAPGSEIENKEVLFVIRNGTSNTQEIKAPEFTYPKGWEVSLKPVESNTVKLDPGQEVSLGYHLSGKWHKDTTTDKIEVLFANMNSFSVVLRSSFISITQMPYDGEELIVGKESEGEKNKIVFSISALDGITAPLNINLPESIRSQSINNLLAKIDGEHSFTLEKGETKKIVYSLKGVPDSEGSASFPIETTGVLKEVEIPVRYLKAEEVHFKLLEQAPIEIVHDIKEAVNVNVDINIKRTDKNQGWIKIKPSEFIRLDQSSVLGLVVGLGNTGDQIIQEGKALQLTYNLSGTPNAYGVGMVTFNTPNQTITVNFELKINLDARYENGKTPLHLAAETGQIIAIEELKRANVDINIDDKDKKTPLHWAAQNNQPKAITKLIALGGMIQMSDKDGNTPLHLAAKNGSFEAIEAIFNQKVDIGKRNKVHEAPIHLAAKKGHEKVIKKLIEASSRLDYVDHNRQTPLHLAAKYNHVKAIHALIDGGAQTEAQDKDEETPLHLAAKYDQVDAINALLDKKAQVSSRAKDKRTPLHLAAKHNKINAINALIKGGAQTEEQDKNGETPLHFAAKNNWVDALNVLLDNGAQISSRAQHKRTPLHFAAMKGHSKVIEAIATKKPEAVQDVDHKEETPLHLAATFNRGPAIEALINAGAGMNDKNNDGNTPLHLAAKKKSKEAIQVLVDKGADKRIKNTNRLYAYQIPMDQELIDLLK